MPPHRGVAAREHTRIKMLSMGMEVVDIWDPSTLFMPAINERLDLWVDTALLVGFVIARRTDESEKLSIKPRITWNLVSNTLTREWEAGDQQVFDLNAGEIIYDARNT